MLLKEEINKNCYVLLSCFHTVFVCLKSLRTVCQGGVQCVGGGKWDTLIEQGEE